MYPSTHLAHSTPIGLPLICSGHAPIVNDDTLELKFLRLGINFIVAYPSYTYLGEVFIFCDGVIWCEIWSCCCEFGVADVFGEDVFDEAFDSCA